MNCLNSVCRLECRSRFEPPDIDTAVAPPSRRTTVQPVDARNLEMADMIPATSVMAPASPSSIAGWNCTQARGYRASE